MRASAFWISLLLGAWLPASAQVTVEILLDQQQFLPGESLPAAVRIVNRSGQTLHLGADPDWLTFAIDASDGRVPNRQGDVPVQGEFTLENSKMATKHVDLGPYFALNQPGRYSVSATVRIPEGNRDVASPPKAFDVIEGSKIWEEKVGVPAPAGTTNSEPEVRRYILQQANYLRGQIRLYLRITDNFGSRTFRVFPIGPMVSFSRPEAKVDRLNNLHVLYQFGPRSFNYSVFNPDGEALVRQTHDFGTARPRLITDVDANVTLFGGIRRPADTDIPKPLAPPDTRPQPGSALDSAAASTNAPPAVPQTSRP